MGFASSFSKKAADGALDTGREVLQQQVEAQITNQFQAPPQAPAKPYSAQAAYPPNSYRQEPVEAAQKKKHISGIEYILWGIVLIVYDIVDTAISFFSAGFWEAIEWIPNAILEGAMFMRGIEKKYVFIGFLEFIPFVDYLPIYAIEGLIFIFKGLKGGDKKEKSSSGKQKINISLRDPKTRIVLVGVVLFLALLLVTFGTDSGAAFVGGSVRDFFNGGYQITATKANAGIQNFFSSAANLIQRRVDIATGESNIYISRVDSSKNLGVESEWIANNPTTFLYNEPITFIGTLSGKQLSNAACQAIGEECSERNEIKVTCSTDKGELGSLRIGPESSSGEVTLTFEDLASNSASIQCDFGSASKEGGIYISEVSPNQIIGRVAFLRAEYPLATGADYEVPAVSSEHYLEQVEEGYFDYDLDNVGRTPGPVSIGFVQYNAPLRISEEGSLYNSKVFGFNIENVGDGVIKSVDDLVVYLPEGASYLSCGAEPPCESQKCRFSQESLKRMRNIGPNEEVGVSCYTYLNPQVLDARNPDITAITFNVLAKTTYISNDKLQIRIRNEGFIEEIACGEVCENSQCACSSECSAGLGFVNKGQSCGVVNS